MKIADLFLCSTIVLLILFSQYLGPVPVPVPNYSKGKWTKGRAYIFKLIPVSVMHVSLVFYLIIMIHKQDMNERNDTQTVTSLLKSADSYFNIHYNMPQYSGCKTCPHLRNLYRYTYIIPPFTPTTI